MTTSAFFEDFAVGQRYRSTPLVVERDRIVAFALEFDPQPQHLGDASAAESHFGELVASGWHTAALTMRLLLQALPPLAGGGQGLGLEELAWPHPVRPGDALHVEAEVLATRLSRSKPDRGLVRMRCLTLNQRQIVVQRVTHNMLAARRAGAAGAP